MGHRKGPGRPLGGSRAGVKARGGQQPRGDQWAPGLEEGWESWSDKAAERGRRKRTSAVAGRRQGAGGGTVTLCEGPKGWDTAPVDVVGSGRPQTFCAAGARLRYKRDCTT